MNARMPTLFFGHGSPMNAIEDNDWARAWGAIGRDLPKPRAILSVSAHWYVPATAVTANARPKTIHDFGGFPKPLFDVQYPAPGDAELVQRVQELLAPLEIPADSSWGLDHGTWSVLCHVYPNADIPVVQLSIDSTKPPAFHYELGRQLRPLRDEGILLMGSGDVVHNLHSYAWGRHPVEPFDWATRFETLARRLMEGGIIRLWWITTLWGGMRSCRFRRRSIICRCCMCLGRVLRGRRLAIRLRGWMGGLFLC